MTGGMRGFLVNSHAPWIRSGKPNKYFTLGAETAAINNSSPSLVFSILLVLGDTANRHRHLAAIALL